MESLKPKRSEFGALLGSRSLELSAPAQALQGLLRSVQESAQPSEIFGAVVCHADMQLPCWTHWAATGAFLQAYRNASGLLLKSKRPVLNLQKHSAQLLAKTKSIEICALSIPAMQELVLTPEDGVYIVPALLDRGLLQTLDLPELPADMREGSFVLRCTMPAPEAVPAAEQPAQGEQSGVARAGVMPMEPHPDTRMWRDWFLQTQECWTSQQLADESGSMAKNRSAFASRLVEEGKVFALRIQGQLQFPKFQFYAGQPIPAVSEVLRLAPQHTSGWDFAFFFTAPNPYLGDLPPSELLRQKPDQVVDAANAYFHPAHAF